MKAGRRNPVVRFGVLLALGLLAGSVAQAASATGRASVTILAPERISLAVSSDGSTPVQIENSGAAGFLSLRVRAEIPEHYVASPIDAGSVLQSDQPNEIALAPRGTGRRALVVIYHHY
jgi:hypothetical protein